MSPHELDPAPGTTTTIITATTELVVPEHPEPLTYQELNPKCEPEEFLGPLGAFAVTTLTPLVALGLFYGCNETTGCLPSSSADWRASWRALKANEWPSLQGSLWEWEAAAVYLAWYAYVVLAWALLPGDKVEGTLLRNGKRKVYKMNGESFLPKRP
jgi:delta14-sterol reductase